ncbi:MAG: peptidoglycan DD-metalloendopeptidase family protein [Patescibacteria group bacterium]|nr:peptidoglycan DD-metalloendopeptidase family protein [Patescibacteria group bacterium]MCL5431986.1 peptidoglycan DD-metalloendopeptidase family protein [Patescibacteria group bacterium]
MDDPSSDQTQTQDTTPQPTVSPADQPPVETPPEQPPQNPPTETPATETPEPTETKTETPTQSEQTPVTEASAPQPELPPVDIPIPNFRFPFNGDYPVTFPFNAQATTGEMKAKFSQWGITGHHGIDFGLPGGTEVLAVDAGKILQSSENGDYGISVTIQHPWGQSLYAHLKETKVSEDQEVKAGDLIGISDQTGSAFGPHLHFGIKPNNPNESNGYLGFIDPTQYLPAVSQIPQVPQTPQQEPEKPKEEPAPVQQPVQPEPIPEPTINIEPEKPVEQPQIPQPPQVPQVSDEEIQKQVDDKLKTELDARRLKANQARQTKREEHLIQIEKLIETKKQINNNDVCDLLHVAQSTATNYLEDLVKRGTIKTEGKAKATVYHF